MKLETVVLVGSIFNYLSILNNKEKQFTSYIYIFMEKQIDLHDEFMTFCVILNMLFNNQASSSELKHLYAHVISP